MPKTLTPHSLLPTLPTLPKGARLWIAYSGGCDSTVLLHLLHQLQPQLQVELHAIHIHHGLSPYADQWTEHCRDVCTGLNVPLVALKVNAKPQSGESPEDAARRARYNAITQQLAAGDYLCTAHHQDDQAETLLLQLLRGAGPKGLAAMGVQSALGHATQLRPLLHLSREEIQRYAETHNLEWVDDHSNSDTSYNRNYLRHEVMPLLKQRWPAAARTISRSAEHCAEAAELLEHLAGQDWQQCRGGEESKILPVRPELVEACPELVEVGQVKTEPPQKRHDVINIAAMQSLPLARQKNLLRYWVGLNSLPLPSEIKLHHIINDAMNAAEDRMPCVTWPGAEVRRYDSQLHIMSPLPVIDSNTIIPWPDLAKPLPLPDGRTLMCVPTQQTPALSASHLQQGNVTIRYRQGGERLQPANSPHHKALKQIFQEQRIPHWQRDRVPLVYVDEKLVAVVGICLTQAALAINGEYALMVVLEPKLNEGIAVARDFSDILFS